MTDSPEHIKSDQPAVSPNNTGSRHAGPSRPSSRGNRPACPRDGLTQQRHSAQIWIAWIAWVCTLGVAIILLARRAHPLPNVPDHTPQTTEPRPMDDIDRVTEQTETMLAQRLNNRVRYHGESATHCGECGDAIPERRRELIAGCKTCADCQSLIERRGYA